MDQCFMILCCLAVNVMWSGGEQFCSFCWWQVIFLSGAWFLKNFIMLAPIILLKIEVRNTLAPEFACESISKRLWLNIIIVCSAIF